MALSTKCNARRSTAELGVSQSRKSPALADDGEHQAAIGLSQMDAELLKIEARTNRHNLFPLSEQEVEEMIEQTDSYAAHINGLWMK